jgi:putative nucleotidyltransferase with HDIG domain
VALNRRLRALLAVVALTSGLLLASALLAYHPAPNISIKIDGPLDDTILGIVFWVGLSLVGSSLAVRMPSGSVVDVAFAPVIAAVSLGGPYVAAWVGLFGTTQGREVRRQVPWYGVVANHCAIVVPAILSAFALETIRSRNNAVVDFLATVAAAVIYFTLNVLITSAFISVRDGESLGKLLRGSGGAYLTMLALAPVAWLMAQMYIKAGWWAVLLFAVPLYTTRGAYRRFVEVREMFTETVSSLAEAVDKRDQFTSGHSRNVQKIAMDIGRVMKVSDTDLEALEWGGLLHDIGKIGVPDSVLLKQERLTREERATMNSHPVLGAEIIAPVTHLAAELPIIRHHHEWFNGSGYPDRQIGDEIPKLARILHVADAFEAMTAARPYRMTPLTPEQALAELRKFGGIQFDPDVVDAFVKTKWARGLADPGSDAVREVPMIGQAAVSIVSLAGATPTGTST